jgi:PAS domain S-box-containing protein
VKLLSPEGLLVDMNRSGLEMLEAESREEVIGKEVIGLVVPEHRAHFLEIAQRAFQEGSGFGEFEMVGLKGTRRWMETHAVPLWDEASQSNLLLAVTRDITARKLAESEILLLQAQLHQAQKMESLGSLAGGVAHDMNNVLGAILGLASAHIEGQPPGSPTHQAFATIIKAAERGATMLRSLLSFARQSSAEMRALDLNALIREEVHLLERTTLSRIHLVLDLAPDLHCMLGDASALTHALMNLCVNAVDAMPQDGTLTLRTRNLNPGWLEVQVEDTGAGLPKEVLEKALDPFFTTKEVGKGTGLGLSIVYSTVQAHHGKLDLRSEIGLGTCVTLRFPTCESATEDPHASGKFPTLASLKGLDILLVDDDELIQCSMQGVLGGLGHRVSIAPSGEEALARLEAGWTPDLVILDMNMPGLGGARTLPLLRALRPDLPVLLATGRADQTAVDLVAAHPHVTLLSKPFGMKELKAQLAAFAEG